MKLKELIKLARLHKIRGRSKMNKAQLETALIQSLRVKKLRKRRSVKKSRKKIKRASIYCGNNGAATGGKPIGTKHQCLKVGIGKGLYLPCEKSYGGAYDPIDDRKMYCGDKQGIPAGYDIMGSPSLCLKVGIGLGKAQRAQNGCRKPRRNRKVSRKRRSVKRKVSRKRGSVKRKVSRKRGSVKRKVSRKRRSVKRKVKKSRKSKFRNGKKVSSPGPDEDWRQIENLMKQYKSGRSFSGKPLISDTYRGVPIIHPHEDDLCMSPKVFIAFINWLQKQLHDSFLDFAELEELYVKLEKSYAELEESKKSSKFNMGDGVSPLMEGLPNPLLEKILQYDSRSRGDLHPAGHLYGPDSIPRQNLRRRMRGVVALQRKIRRNQQVQVALPGYRVGDRISAEDIIEFMEEIYPRTAANLTKPQKREIRRLLARAYTHKDDGYKDKWLFGEGPMANTSHNRPDEEQRREHRAALLAQSQDPWETTIGGHLLPLPLRILRKGSRYNLRPSNRYPMAGGRIDETHDFFWPETRAAVRKFLHKMPTLEEIETYGW